jgi:hypothetical protein
MKGFGFAAWKRQGNWMGLRWAMLVLVVVLGSAVVPATAGGAPGRVTQLVSVPPPGGPSNLGVCSLNTKHYCETPVTPDGGHVLFLADALYTWSGGDTALASVGPAGRSDADDCGPGIRRKCIYKITPDGKHVFFETRKRLTFDDNDGRYRDIYERFNGTTRLISAFDPSGGDGQYDAELLYASDDGSRVMFSLTGYPDGSFYGTEVDAGVWERVDGETRPFPSETNQADGTALYIRSVGAARDGSRVFFETSQSLTPSDTDACRSYSSEPPHGCYDVYERTRSGVELVSTGSASGNEPFDAGIADATLDGRHVLFTTQERLVTADDDTCFDANGNPWGCYDVYERSGDETRLVSLGPSGGAFADVWGKALISDDGRRAFFSTDESLTSEDTDSCPDFRGPGCFDVYEDSRKGLRLLSTGPSGGKGPLDAYVDGIAARGKRVFFETGETLTSTDSDQGKCLNDWRCRDVYERSRGNTVLISTGPADDADEAADAWFFGSSRNGDRVFFGTGQALVAGDRDSCHYLQRGCPDVYERFRGSTTLISTGPSDDQRQCDPFGPFCPAFIANSPDGRRVFFASEDPLVSVDDNNDNDIYVSTVTGRCQVKKHGQAKKYGHKQKKCAGSARYHKHRARHK